MPRGVGLDRARVVAEAARIADESGPDALTLARLADELGVRSPSLFKHVRSLDDLRMGVAATAWDGLDAAVREHPRDLVAVASAWRGWANAHPGVYALLGRIPAERVNAEPAAARLLERVLDACAVHTGPGEPAVHAARALRALVHGFVLLEAGGGFGLATSVDASFARAVEALVAGLPRVH